MNNQNIKRGKKHMQDTLSPEKNKTYFSMKQTTGEFQKGAGVVPLG